MKNYIMDNTFKVEKLDAVNKEILSIKKAES
jgi:hypothetical protein